MDNEVLLYYDLCGFKNYVLNNGAQKAYELYEPYLTGANFGNKMRMEQFNLLVLSDTILVQTKPEVDKKLLEIITFAQREALDVWHRFIAGGSIDLPIKGAIGFDEQIFGNYSIISKSVHRPPIISENIQLIIGKTIVRCYEWEKLQDWFCVSICPEYIESIMEKFEDEFNILIRNNYLVEYDIPIKENRVKRGYALNNYYYLHPDLIYQKINAIINSTKDNGIKVKYSNTLKFFDYIRSKNLTVKNF